MFNDVTDPSEALRGVRGICFDLDNTLYDRDAAALAVFTGWLGAAPSGAPGLDEVLERDADGYSDRVLFFDWLGAALHQSDLWQRYQESLCRIAALPDDSRALLELLRDRGVPRAILTNGGHVQRLKIAALGLEAFIPGRQILVSGELGVDKPDPRAFAAVSDALALPPPAILFVGDHPEYDIRGARESGFRTCWLRRDRRDGPPGADLVINSLADLTTLAATMPANGS